MIKVNIASARGHDVETFDTAELAVEFISKKAKDESKWVFIDGELINNFDDIDFGRIESAQDITLSNQLIGG
jgi:hypothetical protein